MRQEDNTTFADDEDATLINNVLHSMLMYNDYPHLTLIQMADKMDQFDHYFNMTGILPDEMYPKVVLSLWDACLENLRLLDLRIYILCAIYRVTLLTWIVFFNETYTILSISKEGDSELLCTSRYQ